MAQPLQTYHQMRDVDLQNTLRMNLVMMRTIMLGVTGTMGLVVTMTIFGGTTGAKIVNVLILIQKGHRLPGQLVFNDIY